MKELFKAINKKIKSNFPSITIQSTDVKEGFKRPCFYVDFGDVTSGLINSSVKEKRINITIYYFPSDQYTYKVEVLEVLGKLQDVFDGSCLELPNMNINILETDGKVSDGVLVFDFELEYIEDIQDADLPIIEELELNI